MTASIVPQVASVEKVAAKARAATGIAAAAFISSGIGCFAIGLMVTLAEMSTGIKNALNWWNPAGPLAGKTGVGILAWLISWAVLHFLWKDKEVNLGQNFTIALVLIALGFALTFPPIFDLFAGG